MRSLARWCFKHRRIVVVAWLAALVGVTAIHSGVGSGYSDNFKLPHTESFDAVRLLQRNAPKASGDTDQIVFATNSGKLTDPANRARVQRTLVSAARTPHVTNVSNPYSAVGGNQISPSGEIGYSNVTFDVQPNKISHTDAQAFVNKITSASGNGLQFQVEGQIAEQGQNDNSASSLGFGFVAAGIVLFIVFGSLLAMALPLITAGIALGTGIAAHRPALPRHLHGLVQLRALAADRARRRRRLRAVHRHPLPAGPPARHVGRGRDRRRGRHLRPSGAVRRDHRLHRAARACSRSASASSTASRSPPRVAVAFTVRRGADPAAGAARLLRAHACSAAATGAQARAGRADAPATSRPAWVRWTGRLQTRPALIATVAAGLLIVLAIPFFSMRLGSADAGSDPAGSTTRKAYDLLAKGFGPGYNGPLQLVAAGRRPRPSRPRSASRRGRGRAHAGVVGSTARGIIPAGRRACRRSALADVYPKGSPQDASTTDLLHHAARPGRPRRAAPAPACTC